MIYQSDVSFININNIEIARSDGKKRPLKVEQVLELRRKEH